VHACRLRDSDWHFDLGRLFEVLEANGVVPRPGSGDGVSMDVKASVMTKKRYGRTLPGTRRRVLSAVVGAVELLRYPTVDRDEEGAKVTFTMQRRQMVAKVIDVGPATSKVVVEFETPRGTAAAAGALALVPVTAGFSLAGWAALRAYERRTAVGFLDNVQRVLEGRGVEEDKSLLPGVHRLRTRSREV